MNAHSSHPSSGISRLLLAPLLALAFLLGAALPCAASGPLDALVKAQQGIDQSDSDLFNQCVDVPAVVGKAADSLLAAMREQVASGNLEAGNLGILLAFAGAAEDAGQSALLKQLLVSEVKSFVATGINGGYFAGTPNESVRASRGSLASALAKMPQGRREIRPGRILSEADGQATVSATFVDPEAGRLPLELGMERKDGQWRVVEIRNAQSLFNQAVKRRK